MATYRVLAVEIKKETPKAYLFECNGYVWLPKSKITVHQINEDEPYAGMYIIELPGWLWYQNNVHFKIEGAYRAMDIAVENMPKTTIIHQF